MRGVCRTLVTRVTIGIVLPLRVRVAVSTLWVHPDRPRPVDAPAVADEPDVAAWLAALDRSPGDDEAGAGRLGLHGRVDSQVTAGEPVFALETPPAYAEAGWVSVVCPWQPTSLDPRGYPGWLRRAHLIPDDTGEHAVGPPDESWAARPGPDGRLDLALAREHLGLPYLWGGLSPDGLDCSGLVHLVHRELARVVPRDAHDQQAACRPVALEEARPGDLYFFARPGRPAHHVGIVTAPGWMIHAAERRSVVEEELDEGRRATLTAAGRLDGILGNP
jgi:hypothetical protein